MALLIAIALFAVSLLVLSFPGERQAGWTRYRTVAIIPASLPLQCRLNSLFAVFLPTDFDRISVQGQDVTDDERLNKLEAANQEKNQKAYEGERMHHFRRRNFRCAQLQGTDLRRADFSDADLRGAILDETELQGGRFELTKMQGARLWRAKLQGAFLNRSHASGANFSGAYGQAAIFQGAHLEGAIFNYALLQGALFEDSFLAATVFRSAQLQGSLFSGSQLELADFDRAQLQGAQFEHRQNTSISFELAILRQTELWGTRTVTCDGAIIAQPRFEAAVAIEGTDKYSTSRFPELIEIWTAGVPKSVRESVRKDLRLRLASKSKEDAANDEKKWMDCHFKAAPAGDAFQNYWKKLFELLCRDTPNQSYIAAGVYHALIGEERNKASQGPPYKEFARRLLGIEGGECPGAMNFDTDITAGLLQVANHPH